MSRRGELRQAEHTAYVFDLDGVVRDFAPGDQWFAATCRALEWAVPEPRQRRGAREFDWEAELFVLQGTIADSVCRWARSRPDVG